MANGTYGIKKPAVITADDVDIYYFYRPTRGSEAPDFSEYKSLDPSLVLDNCRITGGHSVPGLYNLRLPLENFGRKGIYTVYITPKSITTTIRDVSTLTDNYANVRGIVFSITDENGNSTGIPSGNGGLVGYRVDFLDSDGEETGDFRIITSSNLCEPVSQNSTRSTLQKAIRYRFNDSSELIFCTVTPSTAPSFKSSAYPYIGETGAIVRLTNTKFNPILLEIEMTNHDADTISTMLEGPQIRNLDNGIITTFDDEGRIYHQAAYGQITNPTRNLHSDFKIPYTDEFVSGEENKLEEITNQVRNG